MRNLFELDRYRDVSRAIIDMYGSAGDDTCGVFDVPSPVDGAMMRVLASCDGGWDHVSISRTNRCPNWPELEFVKRAFFREDEVAMQLHVTPTEHISLHPYCLHLWRPNNGPQIPLPPGWMVA